MNACCKKIEQSLRSGLLYDQSCRAKQKGKSVCFSDVWASIVLMLQHINALWIKWVFRFDKEVSRQTNRRAGRRQCFVRPYFSLALWARAKLSTLPHPLPYFVTSYLTKSHHNGLRNLFILIYCYFCSGNYMRCYTHRDGHNNIVSKYTFPTNVHLCTRHAVRDSHLPTARLGFSRGRRPSLRPREKPSLALGGWNNSNNNNNRFFYSAHTVLCALYRQLKVGVTEKMLLQGAFEDI